MERLFGTSAMLRVLDRSTELASPRERAWGPGLRPRRPLQRSEANRRIITRGDNGYAARSVAFAYQPA
jgi:hypothetical protein